MALASAPMLCVRKASPIVLACQRRNSGGLTMRRFNPARRQLLKITATTGGALAATPLLWTAAPPTAAQGASAAADVAPSPIAVVLRVNGTEHRLSLDPRTTLLDALRE